MYAYLFSGFTAPDALSAINEFLLTSPSLSFEDLQNGTKIKAITGRQVKTMHKIVSIAVIRMIQKRLKQQKKKKHHKTHFWFSIFPKVLFWMGKVQSEIIVNHSP